MGTLRTLLHVVAISVLVTGSAAHAQDGPQKLPAITLTAGMHLIQAEVAGNSEQRSIGLMHRRKMGTNEGMLFVFESESPQCFWMKNTLLPLSIAFVDADGSVVNIEDMAPQTLNGHCSKKPVRFALEMNLGWFGKRGIKPGSRIQGGPLGK